MSIKLATVVAITAALAACSTPRTVLENPTTGQIAQCGGGSNGSIAGGVIGYEIEKSNDKECVTTYQNLGFDVISTE